MSSDAISTACSRRTYSVRVAVLALAAVVAALFADGWLATKSSPGRLGADVSLRRGPRCVA
jgi:hypothetical protein